jgi:hypothetical protein
MTLTIALNRGRVLDESLPLLARLRAVVHPDAGGTGRGRSQPSG